MSLAQVALCFVFGSMIGTFFGVKLLFWLAKPRAVVSVDLTFRSQPMCPECGKALGTKHFLKETETPDPTDEVTKATSNDFDVTMKM